MRVGIFAAVTAWLLLYWWQPLFLGTTLYSGYTGSSDLMDGFLPLFAYLQEAMQAGRFPPLWNPYSLNGAPFLAEGQVGVFYPFHLAALLVMSPLAAINCLLALDMFLAAAFTYLLGKSIGLTRAGALLAAAVFAGCGFFVAHAQHLNMVHAAVWLPAILWALRRLLERPRPQPGATALLAILVAMQHLAGHPQITYITWLGAALYLVGCAWGRRAQPRALATAAAGSLLAAALGTALAAVQLLPMAEYAWQAGRSQLEFSAAAHTSFPPAGLILFLFPFHFGDPSQGTYQMSEASYGFWQENCVYVGWLPLLLAVLAVCAGRWRRYPLLPFLLLWGIAALVLAMGPATPWFFVAREVLPGFGMFRYPARYTLWAELALALLAGAGLAWLQQLTAGWRPPRRSALLALILGLAAADLHHLFASYNQMDGAREAWQRPPQLLSRLQQEREPFRIFSADALATHAMIYGMQRGWRQQPGALQQLNESLRPNVNAMYDLASPDTLLYTLRLPQHQARLAWLADRLTQGMPATQLQLRLLPGVTELLSSWNVKYLICHRPLTHPDWELVQQVPLGWDAPPVRLYRNRRASPRFVLAAPAAGRWTLHSQAPEGWSGEADIRVASTLIQVETHYLGWKAFVDGRETPITRTADGFRAIAVPAGRHRVASVYNPVSYRYGQALSLVALLALLGLWWRARMWPRQTIGSPADLRNGAADWLFFWR